MVLQFPSLFWDDSVDYFGAAPDGGPQRRGLCSTFWNLHRWSGQPLLTGLLSGLSADQVRLERLFRYLIFLRFLCQCGGHVGKCAGLDIVLARRSQRSSHASGGVVAFAWGSCRL